MRILITNNALSERAGTELYVRDIALSFQQKGHSPIAFSTSLGAVAEELRAAGVSVVDDLNQVEEPPDVIHGHHQMETMMALLHFAHVPAINYCHSWFHWQEGPVKFPRVLRYVAVDFACRERLLQRHQIPDDKIKVLLNFVDLKRFKPRSRNLPERPQRALVFSNNTGERNHVPAVREACRRANIELDVVGTGARKSVERPEEILGDYDIVFAKARCALEALAVGAAVVLCDAAGVGAMVSTKNFEQLRPLNFGIRTLSQPVAADTIEHEIRQYDSVDASKVSEIVRASASSELVTDDLIDLYEDVIAEFKLHPQPGVVEEGIAAAQYLRQLKIEFALHGSASMRFRDRVERIPLLGNMGLKLAEMLTGKAEQ